jgi:phage shock protein PspC (stress-responsive transcriptional regulator)
MRERLYRSRDDRMLFGVAGGMARYLDIDPSIVRIVWALLAIAGGAGILLYIVAAIVIPEAPAGWAPSAASGGQDASGSAAHGVAGPSDATGASDASGASATTGGSGPAWGYRAGIDRRERGGGAVILGLALVGLGAWFLLQRFVPQIDSDLLWPVVLLVLGGALVLGALRR